MSKAVLISIQPQKCDLIANGLKAIEVRKTMPKLETPFKCYIYCTTTGDLCYKSNNDGKVRTTKNTLSRVKSLRITHQTFLNGKVIGEFVCDEIRKCYPIDIKDPINKPYGDEIEKESCLNTKQVNDYGYRTLGYGILYGWHISNLVIYDKPKELSYFCKPVECPRGLQKEGCVGCWDCEIKRPPQSWCYVESGGGNEK